MINTTGIPGHNGTTNLGETIISVAGSGSDYVAGGQDGTLFTVQLSGDSQPVMQGSVSVGGQLRGLAETPFRVYCAAGGAGLAVVDISSRSQPEVVETIDLGGAVVSVSRSNQTLFCGVQGLGLATVKIEGDSLVPQGFLSTQSTPTYIVTSPGRVYAALPDNGILVADSSLADPLQLSTLDLPGADGLALVGDVLLVGRGSFGLSSVEVSDCASVGVQPTTRFIPAGARVVGAENTFWVTDVAVANFAASVATMSVSYLVKDQGNLVPQTEALVLESGEQRVLADVFLELFELEEANGALRAIVSHPNVKVTSRTYNAAGATGTYGQFIPSHTMEEALTPGILGTLQQLQETSQFRTNIGLVNPTVLDVEVDVELYRSSGNLLGVVSRTLEPYEMMQVNRIFDQVGSGVVESGYAVVKVQSADGAILAYASVIDNQSGDPVYVAAQHLVPGTPFDG